MKTLKAKRMAAVAAGAALLGLGIAFAGPLTFQSVPIISNSGQPLVQVVVGHGAKPSDGVAAGNIAAAIGNLAFASVPVTATINTTQASKVLHVAVSGVSSSTGIVPGAEVYFNTSGVSFASGTYGFSTLIGSVINKAITTSQWGKTKNVGASSAQGYLNTGYSTTSTHSPFISGVPALQSATPSTTGGGVQFTRFTSGNYDNVLEVSNSNLPSLLSNAGTYGENEYIWLTGFPVFDQSSGVNNFALLSAGGAYQVTFNNPIGVNETTNKPVSTGSFSLLGENWTIINATSIPSGLSTSTGVQGGKLKLASSLTPTETVYVGQNVSSGAFTVQLADLGQPNANGVSSAALNVYYNGALTNTTSVNPDSITQFNVSGTSLYVNVGQTFAGLYAYEKYAKMKLYSNVFNVTSGNQFNKTSNPDWYTILEWTSSSTANQADLSSIILYNTQTQTLTPGQSISFITSPAAYKLTFVGENQGSANFDPVSVTSTASASVQYANNTAGSSTFKYNVNNTAVTEPAQELVVSSGISNAFTFAGTQTNTLTYDLTPYSFAATGNYLGSPPAATSNTLTGALTSGAGTSFISDNTPLTVTISGYSTTNVPISTSLTFNSESVNIGYNATSLSTPFNNVTSIQLSRAIPGFNVVITEGIAANTVGANTVSLATLTAAANPVLLYQQSGKSYYSTSSGTASIPYNQQNGQTASSFELAALSPTPTVGTSSGYFTYTMNEYPVPYNTTATDSVEFGIYNSTSGAGASPLFQLNYSAGGTKNNMTYATNTQGVSRSFNVQAGFRTEKGSKVASITPSVLTVDMAKAVDMLEFDVGTNSNVTSSISHATVGPFGIGQSLSSLGLPNASVSKVTGTLALGPNATYSITGISNITATPSVSQAISPVLLKNLTTAPLVVLDNASTLNPASSLVLIGSGYVNTLAGQVQTANNFTAAPSMGNGSGYIVQAFSGSNGSGARIYVGGYSAADTTAAANAFIQDLYNNAASGS